MAAGGPAQSAQTGRDLASIAEARATTWCGKRRAWLHWPASARVHPEAIIGPGCRIGEYCVVEQDVVLGAGCVLEPASSVQ